MWVHVTLLDLVQSLIGFVLLVLHVFAFGAIVWLLSGIPREQRTPSVWMEYVGFLSLIVLLDLLFVWWLSDRLMALAGVLLAIANLIVLFAVSTLLSDKPKNRTTWRWTNRILGVACIAYLDAAYLGRLPFPS